MDLEIPRGDAPDTYATFADLYQYCYLVASVVGLVCIRIFGYTDPAAEKLAEETGIAFQLTNILRDVAEDAERSRVYLPLEDLAAHDVTLDSLLSPARGAAADTERACSTRRNRSSAEAYYRPHKLLPLIDRESRPALWVLVRIYRGLLKRIRRCRLRCFFPVASVFRLSRNSNILAVGNVAMVWMTVGLDLNRRSRSSWQRRRAVLKRNRFEP